jgi:uncharacterized protein YqjF (DUF2071 family)
MSEINPSITGLLDHTAHRPWSVPTSPWVFAQSWRNLLFAHWPIPAAAMRALVPSTLALDTYDGEAWISVVPFKMCDVHPRGLPSVPWLSYFPELNVRTYVKAKDTKGKNGSRPGVYFFSLDAANPIAVMLARSIFRLPYFHAQMDLIVHDSTGDQPGDQSLPADRTIFYQSKRAHPGAASATFVARYRPTGKPFSAQPGTLEHWLAERYCLYAVDGQDVFRADIHHLPWPLQPAEAEFVVNEIVSASGFRLPDTAPILHYAERVDVATWPLKRLTT